MKKIKKTSIYAIILLIFSLVTIFFSTYKLFYAIAHPIKYKNIIYANSTKNIPPYLIASVINVESRYDKNAESKKGAIGLMQIKQSTADYMIDIYKIDKNTNQNLFNPTTNIRLGSLYLNYLYKKFGDITLVICAYNAGETIVRNWTKNSEIYSNGKLNYIPYFETKNYLKKVNENIEFYKKYI